MQSTTRRGQRRLIPAESNGSCASITTRLGAEPAALSAREQVWKDVSHVRTLLIRENRETVYPETYSEKAACVRKTGGGGGI